MSSRERLMAVLQGRKPDRIPFSPLIEGYFLAGFSQKADVATAHRAVGSDIMERKVPVFVRSVFPPYEVPGKKSTADVPMLPLPRGIRVEEDFVDGTITRKFITPVGTLTERWEIRESSPSIPFPVEYLIKTPDDIRTYVYLVEHEEFQPYFDVFNSRVQAVGEDGLVTTVVPHTPIQHLLIVHMGIEAFYYLLYDCRAELERLMDLMHARNREVCEIIARSPAEVAIEYENTGTSYVSPDIYARYEMPCIDEYADILHATGKLMLTHMCGRLKGLAHLIGEGRQDGVCDMAPPPTGDWTLAEALQTWGDKQVVIGGLDTIVLRNGSIGDVKRHTEEVLAEITDVNDGAGVILGSGDSVVIGTPLENLQAAAEVIRNWQR